MLYPKKVTLLPSKENTLAPWDRLSVVIQMWFPNFLWNWAIQGWFCSLFIKWRSGPMVGSKTTTSGSVLHFYWLGTWMNNQTATETTQDDRTLWGERRQIEAIGRRGRVARGSDVGLTSSSAAYWQATFLNSPQLSSLNSRGRIRIFVPHFRIKQGVLWMLHGALVSTEYIRVAICAG